MLLDHRCGYQFGQIHWPKDVAIKGLLPLRQIKLLERDCLKLDTSVVNQDVNRHIVLGQGITQAIDIFSPRDIRRKPD
jgi:hypothetical protein